MKDVTNMVREYLLLRGADGLVSSGRECGCLLEDLAPCGDMGHDCLAARRRNCPRGSEYDFLMFPIERFKGRPAATSGEGEE